MSSLSVHSEFEPTHQRRPTVVQLCRFRQQLFVPRRNLYPDVPWMVGIVVSVDAVRTAKLTTWWF